jgi:hypothetical protein
MIDPGTDNLEAVVSRYEAPLGELRSIRRHLSPYLKFQATKHEGRPPEIRSEHTTVGEDKIIGSTLWVGADGRRQERYHVLTVRDGNIVASRAARRGAKRSVSHDITKGRVGGFARTRARAREGWRS